MTCHRCGVETIIIDSRRRDDAVRRRRECPICGHRFTTMEYRVRMVTRKEV